MGLRRGRYREIVETLSVHGFGFTLGVVGLQGRIPFRGGLPAHGQGRPYSQPEHLRLALEELGPTFVKLGQILSTRSDLLPLPYTAELAKLQDAAVPVPTDVIMQTIAGDPQVHIPAVYRTTTTSRVLTLERVHGMKIDDLQALDAAGIDRRELAVRATGVLCQMVFEDGLIHMLTRTPATSSSPDGSLAVIDFGMVGTLTETLRGQLVELLITLLRGDLRGTARQHQLTLPHDLALLFKEIVREVCGIGNRIVVGVIAASLIDAVGRGVGGEGGGWKAWRGPLVAAGAGSLGVLAASLVGTPCATARRTAARRPSPVRSRRPSTPGRD